MLSLTVAFRDDKHASSVNIWRTVHNLSRNSPWHVTWQLRNTGTIQHVQEKTRRGGRLNIGGPDYSDPSCVLLPLQPFNVKQKHVGAGQTPAKNCQEAWSSQLLGILVIEHKNTVSRAQTRGVSLPRSLGSFDSVVRKTLQGRRREDLFFCLMK